ncbi:Ig-like domain-containing protein [Krasilnikovia cinnamomea]|uniref:Ig-like domain-containing protein n=1 Tax=Krasilnikovia cinnamomea TaxID=349313 RepID=A0A4Q7ZDI0_9ACTN|nr:Ig-like domain-containing protein [Krasilnikovia cinnamomea]RZU48698.1 Ig-like domain-containing protein [Krasilnikovia cinnamomea]
MTRSNSVVAVRIGAIVAALATSIVAPASAEAAEPDPAAPVISDVGVAAGERVNKTVTIRPVVSDDVAVTKVELRVNHRLVTSSVSAPWTLSWDTRSNSNQDVLVEVTAHDGDGHTTTAATTVFADNSAPVVDIPWGDLSTQSRFNSFTGVVPVTFTPRSANDQDVVRVVLSIGATVIGTTSAAPWTVDWDTTGYQGPVTLSWSAHDASGNVRTLTTHAWADHAGPQLSADFTLVDGYINARDSVFVDARDPAWIGKVELLVNGTVANTDTSGQFPRYLPWDRGAANGPATMTIRASDGVGNVTVLTRTVTVDNDAPVVTATPPAGAKVRGVFTARLTSVKDATGPAYMLVRLDDGTRYFTGRAPWSLRVDTRSYSDGPHTLSFDVRDKANNQTLVRRSVTVDNTAPSMRITKAPKNRSKLRRAVAITASAQDRYGVNRVQMLVNGKVVATDRTSGYAFSLTPHARYGKTFTMQLRAYDQAGNVHYSSKRTYRR